MMDSFGRKNAGKEVTTEAFEEHVASTGKKLGDYQRNSQVFAMTCSAIQAFDEQRDKTLIVYGTSDDESANRLTAEALQEVIRTHWSNQIVPIKSDKDVSDDELRNHHLLLIGRPDTNRIVEAFRDHWPVKFGARSFTVRGETYAHAGSAVLTAAANPLNPRYSAVILAGLSAEATTRTPEAIYRKECEGADVLILPHGGRIRAMVAPAPKTANASKAK